jgi:hypothetical protein
MISLSIWPLMQDDDDSSVHSKDDQPEYASEILDEFTTHRGELKHRVPSFRDERLFKVPFKFNIARTSHTSPEKESP